MVSDAERNVMLQQQREQLQAQLVLQQQLHNELQQHLKLQQEHHQLQAQLMVTTTPALLTTRTTTIVYYSRHSLELTPFWYWQFYLCVHFSSSSYNSLLPAGLLLSLALILF